LKDGGAGHIIWAWKRDDVEFDDILLSDQCWTLRVPLLDRRGDSYGSIAFYRRLDGETPAIDISRLCGPFQRELSAALERLIAEKARR
jgi:hypothetical protein